MTPQNSPSLPPHRSRRQWLATGGVGLAAAAAGLWWRSRGPASPPTPTVATSSAEALGEDFWALQLERPDGTPVALSTWRGQPLVINFWATWCPPCVREMPQLQQFHRQHQPRGWTVLGLAVDGPTPVRHFLDRTPVDFPILMAGLVGTDWVKRLGNPQAGLPYTVMATASGAVVHRHQGETTAQALAALVAALP